MARRRGAFILFEGLDRTGKSTQCRLLDQYLNSQGYATKVMSFPSRTTAIGTMINSYLQNTVDIDDRAIHLLFSANRWEAKDEILQTLNDGTTLIVDRYAYSGVAFTAAKGMDLDWCLASDKGLPKPDVVLFMVVSPEEAKARGGFGQERYETLSMQQKVAKVFDHLRSRNDIFQVIDASGTVEEVASRVRKVSTVTMATVASSPIRYI